MIALLAAITVCLLIALGIWAALRPYDALILLLALLVFHSGAVHVLDNLMHINGTLLALLSAWKEAVIAGLFVAALFRFRRRPVRLQFPAIVAICFLFLVAFRVALDIVAHVPMSDELLGARDASEFAIVFLAVTVLQPDVAWLRRASWVLVPLVLLAAEAGIVQLLFPPLLYKALYQAAGVPLASAFSARFGGAVVLRAVGTYTAPNEFGLGLTVVRIVKDDPALFQGTNMVPVGMLVKGQEDVGFIARAQHFTRTNPDLENRGSAGDGRGNGHERHDLLFASSGQPGQKTADCLNAVLRIAGDADDRFGNLGNLGGPAFGLGRCCCFAHADLKK